MTWKLVCNCCLRLNQKDHDLVSYSGMNLFACAIYLDFCLLYLFFCHHMSLTPYKILIFRRLSQTRCWFLCSLSSLYPNFTFLNADIRYKSPTLFPSTTAKADRIDKEWKDWRSSGVCSRRTGSTGRRKCNYSSLNTMFVISTHFFFTMQCTSLLNLYYRRRKASLQSNSVYLHILSALQILSGWTSHFPCCLY